jgi:uncharacterized protein (UPF0335 family)
MSYPANAVAGDQLKAFIERIERLEEERSAIAGDIGEVYAEAKGNGFDKKIIKLIVRRRKMDHAELMEQEALLELYMSAIGMAPAIGDDEPHVHVHEAEWQAPRMASLGDQRDAYRSGKPISQDFRFENASVYAFVFPDLGRVKIGVSNDVEARLAAIEKEVGSSGNLFYSRAGNRKAEMAMHERFSVWRIDGGEWFIDCDDFRRAFTEYAEEVAQ